MLFVVLVMSVIQPEKELINHEVVECEGKTRGSSADLAALSVSVARSGTMMCWCVALENPKSPGGFLRPWKKAGKSWEKVRS